MSDLEGLKTRIEDIENDVMVNKSDIENRFSNIETTITTLNKVLREIENRINYRGPLAY